MNAATDLRHLPARAADLIDRVGCECGCGQPAPIKTRNPGAGEQLRFVAGHSSRGRTNLTRYEVQQNGCWNWTGPLNREGYGRAQVNGRHHTAHRAVYVSLRGPVPDGLHVDHLCHNTTCVNPDHMDLVSPVTNNRRKKRMKITENQAQEIRTSKLPTAELMCAYGISGSYVDDIRGGRAWRTEVTP